MKRFWSSASIPARLLLVVCAMLSACDASERPTLARNGSSLTRPASAVTVKTLGWIEVQNGRLVDEFGREWLLRGINARVDNLFDVTFEDGRTALEPIPAYGLDDASQMSNFGFNLFRLPINWSGLEPHEGEISEAYLQNVDRVVQQAQDAGLYVLVDMHQDAWSKEIGEDGAPLWAIYPAPKRLLEGPLEHLSARRVSPQVLKAYHSYFKNAQGLQDRFMPAWQTVIERYRDRPGVIGFELMNEPMANYALCSTEDLYTYYVKGAQAMREIDDRHTLWLEPDVSRNQLLRAPLRRTPFPDDNVVYEPHLYSPIPEQPSTQAWIDALDTTFQRMTREADSWGAALMLGEWGVDPQSANAPFYMEAVQSLTDSLHFGQAFWLWKENSQGSWGMFDFDETTGAWLERTGPGMDTLRRPGVMAVPGEVMTYQYDPASKLLNVIFDARGGEAPPLVYLPSWHYPSGARVQLDGRDVTVTVDPETQRAMVPWDGTQGTHQLVISP